ncbi:hypothetical protein [Krasilnikoviella flava]|uniref:Heparinase II/III-like protein n=1 Tax=Krasilnikoviella flava TaxID=526729 RepID=A0A1T5LYQ2_9MICO|nr:hypothetical protein [Krasilnikoviella flava]SKC81082.1 hypothetical protein SAMN04324258_4156 [Krasilnikoviella flava]
MRPDRLTRHARDLTTRSLEWMDGRWDPAAGLLRAPDPVGDEHAPAGHLVRETAWYALGLLMRDDADGAEPDADRARHALGRVLDHQIDAPGTRFHGTWLRSPHEEAPTAASVEWRDYDPNWREFVGTTLVVIATEFPEALDDDLRGRVDAALRRAVEGTLARDVDPSYTNIALLRSFLLQDAATRLGEPAWEAAAADLAEQVLERFRVDGAFDEYCSPTYYGIDLVALALWRRYARLPLLRAGGTELEAALWRDTAAHYHAGLRNLAGPYDRSYGMDLRRYASGVGLWIWLAAGPDAAPFPATDRPFRHAWDLALGPLVALLGAEVPADAQPLLDGFRGPRQAAQVIARAPRRTATWWVGERLLVGAEDVGGVRGHLGDQFHPATVHWHAGRPGAGDDVGWARLVSDLAVDARADGPSLSLSCARHDRGDVDLTFQVRAPGAGAGAFTSRRWRVPGLDAVVTGDAELVAVEHDGREPDEDTWWLRYVARDVPADRPVRLRVDLHTDLDTDARTDLDAHRDADRQEARR